MTAALVAFCVWGWRAIDRKHMRDSIREADEVMRREHKAAPQLRVVDADAAHLDRVYGNNPARPATRAGCACINCSVDRYTKTGYFCEGAEKPPANWRDL